MKFSTLVRAGVFSLATTGIYPQALSNNDGGFLSKAHATPRDNAVHPMGPVTGNQMDQMETVVPGTVLFHHTNVSAPGLVNMTTPTTPTDGNRTAHGNETDTGTGTGTGIIITGGTGNGTMATWPYKADNITACTAPTYENTSPLRTKIIRDDCEALLPKVLAQAGFWELYQWTGLPGNGNYTGLLAQGTCQFAVSRIFDEKLVHDQGQRQGGGIYTNASSAMSGGGVVNATNVAIIGNKDVYNLLHAAVYDFAFEADEPYMDKMTTQGRIYCQFQGTANATLDFKLQYLDDGDASY